MDLRRGLTLTALIGRPVRSADGDRRGAVRDLTVRLSAERPRVGRVLVGQGGKRWLLPWSAVAVDRSGAVMIVAGQDGDTESNSRRLESRPDAIDLAADEVLLGRDVLDCQIIDLAGRRVTRASDVVLGVAPGGDLVLVGIEVGVRALIRRLGFPWFAGRLRERVLPIDQLHLSSSRGHQVQLALATSPVHQLDAAGLAQLLTRLDVTKATDVIRSVGPDRAAAALLKSHPAVGRRLMSALPGHESAHVRRHLPVESTVSHPHLHEAAAWRPRRLRRLAGWTTQRPPTGPS